MLAPVNRALDRALRGRAGLAAVLLTIASVLLILLPAVLLGVAFANRRESWSVGSRRSPSVTISRG